MGELSPRATGRANFDDPDERALIPVSGRIQVPSQCCPGGGSRPDRRRVDVTIGRDPVVRRSGPRA
jgi:hypothetical protein